ncbi:MAG: TonB-dependent receptor [Pyrinomonadaceae bacterium]
MFACRLSIKNISKPILLFVLTAFFASMGYASETPANLVVETKTDLGVIKGIVRDDGGNPIADAYVSIFRAGTSKLLKQVRSASNGSFLAKILPGTYTILAVAQGFNPVTLATVEVNRSAELVYGFKLERSGSGNTLPEKRVDRNNPKWIIRSTQASRSIYQADEDDTPIDETAIAETTGDAEEEKSERKGQTVVESYFSNTENGSFTGLNVARLQPLGENSEIIVVGQTGAGNSVPNRFEANLKFRPTEKHQIHLNGSIVNIGKITTNNREKSLGQFSFQALDEWKIRSGVIVVFGFDYSRFLGAGDDFSIAPRLGLQFDINSKTRFRTSYTTQTEERTWQRAIEIEGSEVFFREPVSVQDIFVENEKPQMSKAARLEFGIERVLSNKSNIEASAFFDTVSGRGVGLTSIPFDILSGANFTEFVTSQEGGARGVRVVYTRRINGMFSTAAGYALGNGQKLSGEAVSNPANAFEDDFFQTFFGQFDTELSTGTQIRTIFRLSPQATVFAIDPFQGRMAIYDPNLSVLVTQNLPTLGLPIRAEAIIDARNLFDSQSNIITEDGSLKLNSRGRTLRGGISVRF